MQKMQKKNKKKEGDVYIIEVNGILWSSQVKFISLMGSNKIIQSALNKT